MYVYSLYVLSETARGWQASRRRRRPALFDRRLYIQCTGFYFEQFQTNRNNISPPRSIRWMITFSWEVFRFNFLFFSFHFLNALNNSHKPIRFTTMHVCICIYIYVYIYSEKIRDVREKHCHVSPVWTRGSIVLQYVRVCSKIVTHRYGNGSLD